MATLKSLDISSTGHIQLPNGSNSQRIASETGMMRFNNSSNIIETRNNNSWINSNTGIITNGLVLELDAKSSLIDDAFGLRWEDTSGYGNNGDMYNGPVKTMNNVSFDGVDDYIDFRVSNLTTTATIEMWVNISSASSYGFLMGWRAYGVYWWPPAGFGFNTGASDVYGISTTAFTQLNILDNWHHFIFETRSDVHYSNNKIYIDGKIQILSQLNSAEFPSNRDFDSGRGRIASWRATEGYYLNIKCSAFRVYNRSLTQAEINNNYNVFLGRYHG